MRLILRRILRLGAATALASAVLVTATGSSVFAGTTRAGHFNLCADYCHRGDSHSRPGLPDDFLVPQVRAAPAVRSR